MLKDFSLLNIYLKSLNSTYVRKFTNDCFQLPVYDLDHWLVPESNQKFQEGLATKDPIFPLYLRTFEYKTKVIIAVFILCQMVLVQFLKGRKIFG